MPKDFANSYEQKCWRYAADSHARLTEFIKQFPNSQSLDSFKETVANLEKQYPMLNSKQQENKIMAVFAVPVISMDSNDKLYLVQAESRQGAGYKVRKVIHRTEQIDYTRIAQVTHAIEADGNILTAD